MPPIDPDWDAPAADPDWDTPKPDRSALDAYVLARGRGDVQGENTTALNETLATMPQAKPVRTYARPEDMNVPGMPGEDARTSNQKMTESYLSTEKQGTYNSVLNMDPAQRAQSVWVERNRGALANIAAGEAMWGRRMNPDYFRKPDGDLDVERSYKFYSDIEKRHRTAFTKTEAVVSRALDTLSNTATLGLWQAFGPMNAADRDLLRRTEGVEGSAADVFAQTAAATAGAMAPIGGLGLVKRAEASLLAMGMAPTRAASLAPTITMAYTQGVTKGMTEDSAKAALQGAVEGAAFAAGSTKVTRSLAPAGSGLARRAGAEAVGNAVGGEFQAFLQGQGIDPVRFMANFAVGGAQGFAGGGPLMAKERAARAETRMNDAYAKARGMESALAGGEVPGPIVPTPDYVQRVRPDDVPLPVTRVDMETARTEGEARRLAARAERGPDDAPLAPPGEPAFTEVGGGPLTQAPLGVKGTKAPGPTPDAPIDPLLPRGSMPEGTDAELAAWLSEGDSSPVEAPPAADRPLGGAELGRAPTGVPGTKGASAKAEASPTRAAYLPPKTPGEALTQQQRLLAEAQTKLGAGKPSKAKMGSEAGATTPEALGTILNPRRLIAAVQAGQRYVADRVAKGVSSALDLPRVAAKIRQITDGSFLPAPEAYRREVSRAMAEESLARNDAEDASRSIRVPKGADPEIGFRYLTGDATPAEVDTAYGAGWSKRADVFKTLRTENSAELAKLDEDLSSLGVIERGDLLSPEAQAKYAGGEKYLVRQYEKILRDQDEGGFSTGGRRMPARHRREDVPLERRIELGEIRDPAVVMAATLAKQQTLLARAKFIREVMNNPRFSKPKEWDSTNPEQPRLMDPGRGWVESQYGGKRWVRDYFAKDLEGAMGTKTGADKVGRFVDGLVSTWKWAVAAGRPAALGRDMLANFTLLPEMAGQSYADPMTTVGDYRAFQIMRAKPGTPEWALKRELIRNGLTDSSSFEPDMLKMLDDVNAIEGQDFPEKVRSYLASKFDALKRGDLIHGTPGVDVAAKPLEWIANFKKAQDAFIRARSVALRMNGGDSLPEAIKFTQDNYPWYGANVAQRFRGGGLPGAALRAVGPVPPFLNFLEWSGRYWAKQALTQPLTVLGVMAGLKAITSYTQATNGVTDDQMADADAVLKPYQRPGMLRPMIGWDNETGSPRSLDLSMTIPFGNEAEALLDMIAGRETDPGSARFFPMGPVGSLLIQRATNHSWLTGRQIADPSLPQSKQDEALSKFTTYSLFPLARDVDKFVSSMKEIPVDARGRHVPDKLISALDAFAGVKYRAPDVPVERWYALRGVAERIDEKLRGIDRIERDARIPDVEKARLKEEAAAEIMDIYARSITIREAQDRKWPTPTVPEQASKMANDAANKAKAAAGGFTPTKGR